MAFAYIQEDDLYTTFEDAKKFMLPLHQPFEEFERIARNKPHPGIDKSLPKVTDGTLAGLISEQPKRIIQQIPTGTIVSDDEWLQIVAEYILTHEILPNAEQVADVIQKCWAATTKALTYGSQPAYVQFINRGEYFGTDFTLPYIKDVLLEPGKLSDRESNVMFLRTWWTKNQIDAVIYKEQYLAGKAKGRKETYESGWDLEALAKLKEEGMGQKDANQQTPTEKGKLLNSGFFEIVHCFQRGIGAEFYSFSPKTKTVVRRKTNKDPRGVIPIHFLYANIDLSNPLGRGSVELSGGMQNLLDFEVQTYQFMSALLMNPPIEKRGTYNKSVLKYLPAAVWDLGTNPESSATPIKFETASLVNFPKNYGLIKSQILNLNQSSDTSVSSDSGNPGFSKTPQGVQANQLRLGVSDNYMRKQFESWFGEMDETMLNLWFAERAGTQMLTVDNDTADKLRVVKPDSVNKNNQIRVEYDSETPAMRFKVDASSSKEEDNKEQLDGLQELIQEVGGNPTVGYYLGKDGYKLSVGEAYRELFSRFGIKDLDKIITNMTDEEKAEAQQAPFPIIDKPVVRINYSDLPPAAQVGALADAGIQIQAQDALQPNVEQQAKATPAPQQDDLSNHPVVKVMDSLQIKFTDLDPTAQQSVLATLGIQSDGQTASVVDTSLKQTQQQLDAAKISQQATDSANDHGVAVAQTAIKAAELSHKADVADTNAQQSDAQLADQQQARKDAAQLAKTKPVGATSAK